MTLLHLTTWPIKNCIFSTVGRGISLTFERSTGVNLSLQPEFIRNVDDNIQCASWGTSCSERWAGYKMPERLPMATDLEAKPVQRQDAHTCLFLIAL